MKRIFFMLSVFVITASLPVGAAEDRPIEVSQLPAKAKGFINKYFSDTKVSVAKEDSDWFEKSYEVLFADGSKVEFDSKGNWKEVDCRYRNVPMEIVPAEIIKYVRDHFPDVLIIQIEKNKRNYEIKMSNEFELKFDMKFNLIEVDD